MPKPEPEASPECAILLTDTPDGIMTLVGTTEDRLNNLAGAFSSIAKGISGHEPAQLMSLVEHHKIALINAFDQWDGTVPGAKILLKTISNLSHRLDQLEKLQSICTQRQCAVNFTEVRHNPQWVMPNRVYPIQADRGQFIYVRFSRKLVEEFFWNPENEKLRVASVKILEAVGRGLYPDTNQSASGIAPLFISMAPGYKLYKIQIGGGVYRSVRVFGIYQHGIFNFVYFEDQGNHDARYLNKIRDRTLDHFDRETWK